MEKTGVDCTVRLARDENNLLPRPSHAVVMPYRALFWRVPCRCTPPRLRCAPSCCRARNRGYQIQYQRTLLDGINNGGDEVDDLEFRRPTNERAAAIAQALNQRGVLTKLRQSAGQDVDAGRGQLRARSVEGAGRLQTAGPVRALSLDFRSS